MICKNFIPVLYIYNDLLWRPQTSSVVTNSWRNRKQLRLSSWKWFRLITRECVNKRWLWVKFWKKNMKLGISEILFPLTNSSSTRIVYFYRAITEQKFIPKYWRYHWRVFRLVFQPLASCLMENWLLADLVPELEQFALVLVLLVQVLVPVWSQLL